MNELIIQQTCVEAAPCTHHGGGGGIHHVTT
jgi:hypothetical protein